MSTTKEELLLLNKTDLTAKYKDVVGEDAPADFTKDKLADAILEKLANQGSNGSGETPAPAPAPIVPTAPTTGAIVAPANQGSNGSGETITLEKVEDDKLVDTIEIPLAVYNNMTDNYKKQYRVKKPDSLQ